MLAPSATLTPFRLQPLLMPREKLASSAFHFIEYLFYSKMPFLLAKKWTAPADPSVSSDLSLMCRRSRRSLEPLESLFSAKPACLSGPTNAQRVKLPVEPQLASKHSVLMFRTMSLEEVHLEVLLELQLASHGLLPESTQPAALSVLRAGRTSWAWSQLLG